MTKSIIAAMVLSGVTSLSFAAPVDSVFEVDPALSGGSTTLSLSGLVTADAGFFSDSDTISATGPLSATPSGRIAATIDPAAATMTLQQMALEAELTGAISDDITLFLLPITVTVTPSHVAVSQVSPSPSLLLTPTATPDLYQWGPVALTLAIALDFSVDTSLVPGFSDTLNRSFSPMVSGTVAVGPDGLPTGYTITIPGVVDAPVVFMTTTTIGTLTADVGVDGVASMTDFELNLVGSSAPAIDTDADSVFDAFDNCTAVSNPDQHDSNGDAIGNLCDPDIDGPGGVEDCLVNFVDLNAFRAAFFATPVSPLWNPDADLNNDGGINFGDLDIVRGAFFGPPGPSAAGCN